jgi:Ca2+-binding EF-hand superfamily protein
MVQSNPYGLISAPERDPHEKDIYSVGMIAYKLLSGGKEPPTDMDTQLVVPGTNLFPGRRWKLISISKNAKHFIEKCLHWDSKQKFTVEQAIQHPWMTQEHVHRSDTSRPTDTMNEVVVVPWNNVRSSITTTSQDYTKHAEEVIPFVSLSAEGYSREVKSKSTTSEENQEEMIKSEPIEKQDDDDVPVFLPITLSDGANVASLSSATDAIVDDEAKPLVPCEGLENSTIVDETVLTEAMDDEKINVTLSNPEDSAVMDETDVDEIQPIIICADTEDSNTVEETAQIEAMDQDPVPETENSVHHTDEPDKSSVVDDLLLTAPMNEISATPDDTSKLEEFAHLTQDETTTPDEFLDLRMVFDEVATDSGGITVDSLKERLKTKYTEEEVNSWFQGEKFEDTRSLVYKVVLRKAIQNRRTIEIERVDTAFKKLDKGRTGFVTVGNLRAVLGIDNSDNIELLIKAADTKRDGRITYENFERVIHNLLASSEQEK